MTKTSFIGTLTGSEDTNDFKTGVSIFCGNLNTTQKSNQSFSLYFSLANMMSPSFLSMTYVENWLDIKTLM